jgi:hypothetical protein
MARIKDIKAQNPEYVIDLISILGEHDPSKTNKYLPFMVSQTKDWLEWFKTELESNTFKEMFDIVKEFEELSERNLLENKDIYSYDNNQDIVDEIKLAREKVTRSEVKKKETLTLYEDDTWLVLQPLTSRSSNLYGKSTKWCVAADDHNFKKYFNDYTKEGVLVFLIDKRVKERDAKEDKNIHAKLAFHKYKTKEKSLTIWNVRDNQLGVSEMMDVYKNVPANIIETINDTLEGDSNKKLATERKLKLDY